MRGGLLIAGTLAVALFLAAAPADAQTGRPPIPPTCRDVIAAHGGTKGIWQGRFSGTYERSFLRDELISFSRVGCFTSRKACERWIYDVRSAANFLFERIVRCEPYPG
ncbi:MAG: hypothetical protein KDJ77_13740 [Rhodobiaceae bacterium]|nr:hypothetical protein [Rhodobiaceae bacterium]